MFSEEFKKLLIQVITSWQVLVVTVVLIIYVFIVNSVARLYHRRRPPSMAPMPKDESKQAENAAETPVPSESDDLILDEEEDK